MWIFEEVEASVVFKGKRGVQVSLLRDKENVGYKNLFLGSCQFIHGDGARWAFLGIWLLTLSPHGVTIRLENLGGKSLFQECAHRRPAGSLIALATGLLYSRALPSEPPQYILLGLRQVTPSCYWQLPHLLGFKLGSWFNISQLNGIVLVNVFFLESWMFIKSW